MRPSSTPFYHCWRARLGQVSLGALSTLSAAEQARLARFHTAGSRRAYAGAHLFLREVLGGYVGQAPAALVLGVDARQKPRLATAAPLWFNLSYRANWAVLAISNQGEVGVDVEETHPVAGADALVEQLFSPTEQLALQYASGSEWWALFYGIWTRKEAWAKLQGMGLALPFAAFSVAAWAETAVTWQPLPPGQLHAWPVDANHVAAVAIGPQATAEAIVWQQFDYPPSPQLAAFQFPQ